MDEDGQKKEPTGRRAPPWVKPALRRPRETTGEGRELDLAWRASQECLARCCEAVADELEAAVAALRARARR